MGSKSISGVPQPQLGQQIPNPSPAVMSSGPQSWDAATQGGIHSGLMSQPFKPVANTSGGQTVPGMSSETSQFLDQFKSTGTATPPQSPSTPLAPMSSLPAGFNPAFAQTTGNINATADPHAKPAFGKPAGACPTCGK